MSRRELKEELLKAAGMKIFQRGDLPKFAIDTVLIASFARSKGSDVVVDIGAGNGASSLIFASKNRFKILYAVEIQRELADLAKLNVDANNLSDKICVLNMDARRLPEELGRSRVDVVFSNPPYKKVGEGLIPEEDTWAIAHHEVYLTLSELLGVAVEILKPYGRLFVVYRPERVDELLIEAEKRGFSTARLRFVFPYVNRDANFVLAEFVKHGNTKPKVEPPLIIFERDKIYTEEMERIYRGERIG